jgi:hypothetical protein
MHSRSALRLPLPALLALLFCSSCPHVGETLIPAGDPRINYYGRFDFSDAAGPAFNWPGSTIEAGFTGTRIGVELDSGGDGGGWFNVEIDGRTETVLGPSQTSRRLIRRDLAPGPHLIRLVLRNEEIICRFKGFYVGRGDRLLARPRPERKIEFIGDSWTAGFVTEAPADFQGDSQRVSNAGLSYARLTSAAFRAQDQIIARQGCGMARSLDGDPVMAVQYRRTLVDGTKAWNFDSWMPDLVVIFLGINDFRSGIIAASYREAYRGFLFSVRGFHPGVPIICIVLPGAMRSEVEAATRFVPGVYTLVIPVTQQTASAPGGHPSPAEQRKIADTLIPLVASVTNWKTDGK